MTEPPTPVVWTPDNTTECTAALQAMADAAGRLAAQRLVRYLEEVFEIDPRFTRVILEVHLTIDEVAVEVVLDDDGDNVCLGHRHTMGDLIDEQQDSLEALHLDINSLLTHGVWAEATRHCLNKAVPVRCEYARGELDRLQRAIVGEAAYDAWAANEAAGKLHAELPDASVGRPRPRV